MKKWRKHQKAPNQHKASDVKAKQIPARPTFSLVEAAAVAAELSSMFAPRMHKHCIQKTAEANVA